jgi:hypothetical protein
MILLYSSVHSQGEGELGDGNNTFSAIIRQCCSPSRGDL